MLTEATSAAGVYVGMTRGREQNQLHIVAENTADARAQFIEAMERDPADRGLDHATRAAKEAVRGLIADGPVRLVTDELARLDREAARAERQAERWAQTAARFDAQHAARQAEDEETAAVLRKAEETAEQVRTEVAGPLTVQARQDGSAYLDAVADAAAASGRLATVGRLGRRKARNEHQTATERAQSLRGHVSRKWGTAPANPDRLPEWASKVATKHAETDPRVADAVQMVETATSDRAALRKRHKQEHLALLVSEYGADRMRRDHLGMRAANPLRNAQNARARATMTRAEADELRGLPVNEAAERIEAKRGEQEHLRQLAAERARQFPNPFEPDPHRSNPRREGPGFGR